MSKNSIVFKINFNYGLPLKKWNPFGFRDIKKGWKRYEESLNVNKILVLLSFSHSLLKCIGTKIPCTMHDTQNEKFSFDFVLMWTRFPTRKERNFLISKGT